MSTFTPVTIRASLEDLDLKFRAAVVAGDLQAVFRQQRKSLDCVIHVRKNKPSPEMLAEFQVPRFLWLVVGHYQQANKAKTLDTFWVAQRPALEAFDARQRHGTAAGPTAAPAATNISAIPRGGGSKDAAPAATTPSAIPSNTAAPPATNTSALPHAGSITDSARSAATPKGLGTPTAPLTSLSGIMVKHKEPQPRGPAAAVQHGRTPSPVAGPSQMQTAPSHMTFGRLEDEEDDDEYGDEREGDARRKWTARMKDREEGDDRRGKGKGRGRETEVEEDERPHKGKGKGRDLETEEEDDERPRKGKGKGRGRETEDEEDERPTQVKRERKPRRPVGTGRQRRPECRRCATMNLFCEAQAGGMACVVCAGRKIRCEDVDESESDEVPRRPRAKKERPRPAQRPKKRSKVVRSPSVIDITDDDVSAPPRPSHPAPHSRFPHGMPVSNREGRIMSMLIDDYRRGFLHVCEKLDQMEARMDAAEELNSELVARLVDAENEATAMEARLQQAAAEIRTLRGSMSSSVPSVSAVGQIMAAPSTLRDRPPTGADTATPPSTSLESIVMSGSRAVTPPLQTPSATAILPSASPPAPPTPTPPPPPPSSPPPPPPPPPQSPPPFVASPHNEPRPAPADAAPSSPPSQSIVVAQEPSEIEPPNTPAVNLIPPTPNTSQEAKEYSPTTLLQVPAVGPAASPVPGAEPDSGGGSSDPSGPRSRSRSRSPAAPAEVRRSPRLSPSPDSDVRRSPRLSPSPGSAVGPSHKRAAEDPLDKPGSKRPRQ